MPVKAVILAAGMGSRLCPLTPFIPKEMVPVGGFPAIHHVLAELSDGGVTDVLVVLSKGKQSVQRYLTETIHPKGETAMRLSEARDKILSCLKISFAMQGDLRGTAHAIYLAKDFMGENPLLVVYPDDLLSIGKRLGENPCGRLVELCKKTDDSVLLAGEIDGADASQYGVLQVNYLPDQTLSVTSILEKPKDYSAKKAYVLIGRMVITPRVMHSIPHLPLTDSEGIIPALIEEAKRGSLRALVHTGTRYDLGSHDGYASMINAVAQKQYTEALYGEGTLSNLSS